MTRMLSLDRARVTRRNQTLFVAVPAEMRRDIEGGCRCGFCVAHPDRVPQWDTLALARNGGPNARTWTVHCPELCEEMAHKPS